MNVARIGTVAINGFREVIRDRVLYFIGFFAILLVLSLNLLPEVAAGSENKIFLDFGLGAMGLLGAIVSIFVGTGLINKEISRRTVLVIIPKPISRGELILGKHLGLSGVLVILVAAMTVIYLALLSWSQVDYPLGSILVSILLLLIELFLLAAIALVFGVFTSELLATLLTFAVYLMGHLSRDLVTLGKLSENEQIQAFTYHLYLLLPDLSRLNLRSEAVYDLLPSPLELLTNGMYGLVYTLILLGIAILIFSLREF